jgi:hypothetical protein
MIQSMAIPTETFGIIPLPTEAEVVILQILWKRSLSTVREIDKALQSRGTGYITALKQMQVMAERGLVARSERCRSHLNEAWIPRRKNPVTVDPRTSATRIRWFGGKFGQGRTQRAAGLRFRSGGDQADARRI